MVAEWLQGFTRVIELFEDQLGGREVGQREEVVVVLQQR